jgi:hypothetical protein
VGIPRSCMAMCCLKSCCFSVDTRTYAYSLIKIIPLCVWIIFKPTRSACGLKYWLYRFCYLLPAMATDFLFRRLRWRRFGWCYLLWRCKLRPLWCLLLHWTWHRWGLYYWRHSPVVVFISF